MVEKRWLVQLSALNRNVVAFSGRSYLYSGLLAVPGSAEGVVSHYLHCRPVRSHE